MSLAGKLVDGIGIRFRIILDEGADPLSTRSDRRTRADAERNRVRVLEAARALFAERGESVQMPEVARAAGVGIGTVYRHFPSRQALIEAAAEHRFAQIAQFAREECMDRLAPGQGLRRYLNHVGDVLAADQGLTAAIQAARGAAESEPRGQAFAELAQAVAALIEQDQAAGALRDDVTPADVYMIVGGLSSTIRTRSGDWRRYIDLVLDGLRRR